MADADDWPTFGEELGRKAMAEIDKWASKYEAGHITRREAFIAVSTIYDTISGLAPKDVCNVIADIHRDIRTGKA